MGFWAPNLGRAGRLMRAGIGIALLLAGLSTAFAAPWAGLLLAAAGAFALFEAARGWCLARACGLK